MQCGNKLHQIGIAMHNYHEDYECFPPAYTVDEHGKPLHSWRVLILPYIEQKELYEKIRLDEPWNSEHNRQFHDVFVGAFSCPSSARKGIAPCILPRKKLSETCYYSVVIGPETVFPGSKTTTFHDVTDGTSNTLLVVERLLPVCWMDPNNEIRFETACEGINSRLYGIGSVHSGGACVALVDGSIRFFGESIEPKIMRAWLTESGGENVVP
jgi:hypothetical protein